MGYYIETSGPKHKAGFLIAKHGAIELPAPKFLDGKLATVCVVDNGPFEAAGICFDKGEFEAFNLPHDHRPKRWLGMAKEEVIKLCPPVKVIFDRIDANSAKSEAA